MEAGITISIESPRQDEVVELIRQLDELQNGLYPPVGNHLLSIDDLDQTSIRFFVVREGDVAVGCGALRIDQGGWGEVKRMFVLKSKRGTGLGLLILRRIEVAARDERLTCLRLETGPKQPEAVKLYEKAGFRRRGPFGEYTESPYSVFMEKVL